MPNGSINLTRFGLDGNLPNGQTHTWPLTVQAVGINMPSEIFVYQIGDKGNGAIFKCIATVNDLEELPVSQGVSETFAQQTPFYRASELSVVLRSAHEMNKAWVDIQNQVLELVANFNSSNNLIGLETVSVTADALTSVTSDTLLNAILIGTNCRIRPNVGLEIFNNDTKRWYPITNIGGLGQEQWAMGSGETT